MGQKKSRRPRGYWGDEANIERELRQWVAKEGDYPSKRDLKKAGRKDLVLAVERHGGAHLWRSRLGYASIASKTTKPLGYWNDEANIERALEVLIEQHGVFPSDNFLHKMGELGLRSAVSGRGFTWWRERLDFKREAKPSGYWEDPVNIERELRQWILKKGSFPSNTDFERVGRNGDLRGAVKRHGGFRYWRSRLRYEMTTKPHGYWGDEANIERELRQWVAKEGGFPSRTELTRAGRDDLRHAADRHGGFAFWRAKLGYGPITPKCLREHADVLARVVMALDVADTAAFWVALQKHWTMADLAAAIREYVEEGKIEQFRKLLTAAG